MTAIVLSDELQAQLSAEVDAIYAARCAAGKAARISSREGRDAQSVIGALALDFQSLRGTRKYARHRRAIAAHFGTSDLLYLARRTNHPVVAKAVRAVLKGNGLGPVELAAFTRVQVAEDALMAEVDGPLAPHGAALEQLFGTRDIVEAQRQTMRFLQ